jgi:hypothetical protein
MKGIPPLMLFLPLGFARTAAHLPTPNAKVAASTTSGSGIHESFLIAQNSMYIAPIGCRPLRRAARALG